MRFFSNDNDDNRDQSNVDVQTRSEQVNDDQAHDEHADQERFGHVQSDPVAVPQQRSGSPWSDAPGGPGDQPADDTVDDRSEASDTADAELPDRERTDGTEEPAGDRWDADGAHRAENADAVDLPLDDKDGESSRAEVADTDINTDTTDRADTTDDTDTTDTADATPDETTRTTTTYGPDGTVVTTEDTDSATAAGDADTEADVDRIDGDPALADKGDFDDPQAVDPATDKPIDTDAPDAGETAASETATGVVTDAGDKDATTDTAPAVEPVPVPVGAADAATAAKPGSVTEPELGSLFGEADAQSFQERWRDVQLRFVDSPKDAATEAAALVDEAVDKLTASLKAQKDTVSHDSDDTEQLRVALRGYRDILNRVVGL